MRALMLGWVSSAMVTASSTESTLPNTRDSGLVTGGGATAGGTTGGAVCVGVGVGAGGACAAAFVVATIRTAPASSNHRPPILIALALLRPEHDHPTTCQDREPGRGYHAGLPCHAG